MEKQNSEMQFNTFEEYLQWEEIHKNKELTLDEDSLRQKYMDKIGEPIAMYCIMGNKVFHDKFKGDSALLYAYCLEHNKTWEEVLDFKYEEGVMY